MRRREFIILVGGSTAVWPLAARAQQSLPTIGWLRNTSASNSVELVTAFQQGLREAGYIENQNVAVEYRWANIQNDQLMRLAGDLVHRPVAVIVAGGLPAASAAKAVTQTIPIIFATGTDPVRDGLVGSFNRPSGNITGVTFLASGLGAKRLDLLRQLVPTATLIAMLVNPGSPDTEAERRDVQAAAQKLGQQLIILDASSERDIETSFATFVQRGAGAIFVGIGAFLFSNRERLVALAARHSLPASYGVRPFASAGGLMSYGASARSRETTELLKLIKSLR
jgi:putative ABC transport system substrate-binding protein